MEDKRILLVEDTETHLLLLKSILEEEGYSVTAARNGVEAISLLHERPYSLMLLDLMLPEMTGFEILESIQEDQSVNDTPVIFISAKGDHNSIKSAIEKGAKDYIVKPFNVQDIKNKILTIISK